MWKTLLCFWFLHIVHNCTFDKFSYSNFFLLLICWGDTQVVLVSVMIKHIIHIWGCICSFLQNHCLSWLIELRSTAVFQSQACLPQPQTSNLRPLCGLLYPTASLLAVWWCFGLIRFLVTCHSVQEVFCRNKMSVPRIQTLTSLYTILTRNSSLFILFTSVYPAANVFVT